MAQDKPSPPITKESDKGKLNAGGQIANSAKDMIEQELKRKGEEETIDNAIFNKVIQQVKGMNIKQLNTKLEGDLIKLIKDKYFEGSTRSATAEKNVLPQAPLRFATPVDDDKDIFNTIARSAQNDTATELVRLLRDEKFDKETAFRSYRTILVPDSMGLIENVMPTPSPTKESSPAASPPDDTTSPPPVVSENCKNLVSRRLAGKKQIEQKEYDELIEEVTKGVLGMKKEEVEECLKQNGIKIVPNVAASSSPAAGPVDLSSFTGRVNLQGNLTITGTLDLSSKTLEITGVAPVSISGTVPGVSVSVPAAASSTPADEIPPKSPLSGSISSEEAVLENLINKIKETGFKGIGSDSVIVPSDKEKLIKKLKPVAEFMKNYHEAILLEPSNTESKKGSYSPVLNIANPRISLQLSLKKGKDNQWTLDIPKVDSKNLTAPAPKLDPCEKLLEGIGKNATITPNQYLELYTDAQSLSVDGNDCLIKNGNKVDMDVWNKQFASAIPAPPLPPVSLQLNQVSNTLQILVSRNLRGKKEITPSEYDNLIREASEYYRINEEEVNEYLTQNSISVIPPTEGAEELPVPENLITAADIANLYTAGGGLNTENLKPIHEKLNKSKETLVPAGVDIHKINVSENNYKDLLFTSDIHSDLRKFIQTLQQKDLIIYDGDPYSDDIYKPELLEAVQWKYKNVVLVILGDLVDGQRSIPVDDNAGSFELLLHIFLYNLRLKARQKNSEVLFTIGNHDFNTVIRPDGYMINTYTTANSKTFFGTSRQYALLPFYELSPFIALQFSNGDKLEIEAIHGGFTKRGDDEDKTVFLNRRVFTLQTKINAEGFSNLTEEDITLLNNDPTGVLWTREYANNTVECSDFEKKPMTIVGHCPTSLTFPRFGPILAKDEYEGCDKQESRTSNGCVIVDCEDKDKGPKLAFVDTGMSAAFEKQSGTYNPADRIVEFLWLERDEKLGDTPRWFNTIGRLRTPEDTIGVWKSPPASSTGGGNETLTLQYDYYANPIFVHNEPAPTVNRIEGFVEKQEGAGCGRHALNNFFGNKVFVKDVDKDVMPNIIEEYGYPVSLQTLCDHLKQVFVGVPGEQNYCPEDENYDHNILEAALQLFGYTTSKNMDEFERINSGIGKLLIPVYIEGLEAENIIDEGVVGYLVHHPAHWTSIRVDPKSKKPYTFYNSIRSVVMNDSLSNIYKKHLKDANALFRIKEVFGSEKKTRITKDFIQNFIDASEITPDPDSEFDFFATYEKIEEFADSDGTVVKPRDFVKCKGSKPFKVEGIYKGTSGIQKDNIYVLDEATGYNVKTCKKVEAPKKEDSAPPPTWLDAIKLKPFGRSTPRSEEERLAFLDSIKLKMYGKDKPKAEILSAEPAAEEKNETFTEKLSKLWKSTADMSTEEFNKQRKKEGRSPVFETSGRAPRPPPVSETPLVSITIDGETITPTSKIYVKKYDRNKCLKPGEVGTVKSISVKTWPNKSQVVVNCVNPSGKTDTYAADQLSPKDVPGPTAVINDTPVTIGSKVFVRQATPGRCLEYGEEGTVIDIQTSLFGSKTVLVQCKTGKIDEYLPEELFTKSPVVEYSRSGVDPLSRKPSTAPITCKDANGADIKAGDKVRGLDFKDGLVVEEVQTRTGKECYVKLKFSDDPLVIRYIRSDTVEKVVEGAPALVINPITNDLITRALERNKEQKKIPPTCITSNGFRLKAGNTVKALSPSGKILRSTVLQYAPFLRGMGALSACDILVEAEADPKPIFVVSTSHVEFLPKEGKGRTLRNYKSARQTKRHSAFGGGPQLPTISEKDLLDYDAVFQAIKGAAIDDVKISDLQTRVKHIIERTGDAGDEIKGTPKVYDTINGKNYVFGKADSILTSQKLREVSKVGATAIEIFVQKVETLRDALNNHNGQLQKEVKNIKDDIARTAIRGERLIKFVVTPLQYAVLVGNRDIITALIANNVPMSEAETKTPLSLDKTQYTLEDLATKRKDKDTLRGKGVFQLTQEIKQARRDATEDAEKYPPIKNENYGKDQKGGINETKRLIYLKIFTELMKGKPDIPIDQIKFASEIAMATKDAEAGKPNTTFYKSSIWRERTAPLLGAELAYTRTYDIKRAEIEGERDGSEPNGVKNPEYDKDEYKSQPLAAIKESYMNAFNKAGATDFSLGYEDGLKAAPTSGYVSQFSFLEPGLAQIIFGTTGSEKTREQYRLGYIKGLTQLITPNPNPEKAKSLDIGYYDSVMDSARKAGRFDATNKKPMYTTPATYKAVDTRSLEPRAISLAEISQKTIRVEIKLNNLIQNLSSIYLDKTPDEENIRKTQQIQDKINKLKEEYDKEYANTAAQVRLSEGTPVRPTSTLVSPTGSIPELKETSKPAKEEKTSFFRNPFKSKKGGRTTKKHYKRSPQRRTLRTE